MDELGWAIPADRFVTLRDAWAPVAHSKSGARWASPEWKRTDSDRPLVRLGEWLTAQRSAACGGRFAGRWSATRVAACGRLGGRLSVSGRGSRRASVRRRVRARCVPSLCGPCARSVPRIQFTARSGGAGGRASGGRTQVEAWSAGRPAAGESGAGRRRRGGYVLTARPADGAACHVPGIEHLVGDRPAARGAFHPSDRTDYAMHELPGVREDESVRLGTDQSWPS